MRAVNKWSNNVMTRQILLTMGAERFGPPGTAKKGRQAIDLNLRERGLDFPELRIDVPGRRRTGLDRPKDQYP